MVSSARPALLGLLLFGLLTPSTPADAAKITRDEMIEPVAVSGFEGVLTEGAPGVAALPAGLFLPNGVRFFGPPPMKGQPLFTVADFLRAEKGNPIVYDLGTSGLVSGPEALIDGTAFAASTQPPTEPWIFQLAQPTRALGLYVSVFGGGAFLLSGLDIQGLPVVQEVFASTSAVPLDDDNFVGLSADEDLYGFSVSAAGNFLIDAITVELPAPGAAQQVAACLVALAALRRARVSRGA